MATVIAASALERADWARAEEAGQVDGDQSAAGLGRRSQHELGVERLEDSGISDGLRTVDHESTLRTSAVRPAGAGWERPVERYSVVEQAF